MFSGSWSKGSMLWTCHVLVHSGSHIGPGSSSLVRGHFALSFPLWFRSSHHHPLCSTVLWLWRWCFGNFPPRLHRLLYRPRFVGIGVVNWWSIVFEIKVTLYILDALVLIFFMYNIGPDPFCTTLKNDALCLRQLLCVGCRLQLLRCFWEVEAKETM